MLTTQTYHFAICAGGHRIAKDCAVRVDPEVKRLCGGDVGDRMTRRRGPCAACLRGA